MAISGIGSNSLTAGVLAALSAPKPSAAGAASQPPTDPNDPIQFLTQYLKESPAKRMEDAWLAAHHLSEQELASMPPAEQDAIRKEMADDIKKKLQESSGAPGSTVSIKA